MKHMEVSGNWLKRLEPELIPWVQKELSPKDYKGQMLPVEYADIINIYIGNTAISLHLPPMAFPCLDPQGFVERQFVATSLIADLDSKVRGYIEDMVKRHSKEDRILNKAFSLFSQDGWSPIYTRRGTIENLIAGEKMFTWDCNIKRVEANSVGSLDYPGDFASVYAPDNTIRFFHEDELVGPIVNAKDPEHACKLHQCFVEALDTQTIDSKSEAILNKLFN